MEQGIEDLRKNIEDIKKRNQSVEADKAWEISWLRRISIAIFTYLSISIYLWAIHIDRAWLNAIVPTVGFLLSTLTLPWLKNLWVNNYNK